MKLSIVIPALNEQQSIESIINRTLDAKQYITEHSPVTDLEITVVSDGSTDKTVEIASQYTDRIRLIIFEKNKGYGAAIKEGWRQSTGELLAFLDADGTCDPRFFADLANLMQKENADVVLGSRLNKNSEMPAIRRFGNTLFSVFLSVVSNENIRDTASGMRIIRRDSLTNLMPLPDGLHFTPAMSARAILSDYLKISEIDMPYKEREGESKLNVLKDGVRFLNVIVTMIFMYQPQKILLPASLLFYILGAGLLVTPLHHYISYHNVEEWMIYRVITGGIFATIGTLFLSGAYLSYKIVSETINLSISKNILYRIFNSWIVWTIAILFLGTGIGLVFNSVLTRLETGHTYEHWSRYIAMSFLVTNAFALIITKAVDYVFDPIVDRLKYLQSTNMGGNA
ncbi:MAG: Dolichol-phosphate mannosyltransferase [Bacteroidetes bacterium]|nr:Dolichol-phosphate mannosyltransferase [Bacteroidota bacterium]